MNNICFNHDERSGKISVNIPEFVEYILKRFTFKTVFGSKKDSIYIYNEGIYKLKGEETIKVFSEEKLGIYCKTNIVHEVVEKIKRKTPIDFEEFENIPLNLIPLKNGVYNLETEQLEKYNPNIFFKFKLPIIYKENANCEKFLKLLGEIIYPEHLDLIQEWFGYCLYRKYSIKKGMIWYGETDTRKTTLLNILEEMIGLKNCSGLSLHKISGGSNFDLCGLHDKLLNSFDDLSSADLSDEGGFKVATGGGSITGEYKFGDQFKFKNNAKLLFACNQIPSPKEINDKAYFSRWFPVPFDNQISREDQDPDFLEECLKELSGIFNWSLIGLKRLLNNKKFSYNKTPDEVKEIMCRSGNPLVVFAHDECKEVEGAELGKQEFYDYYCESMRKQKLPAMSKIAFGNNIKRYCTYIMDGWKGNKRCWRNVKVGGYISEKL